MGDRRGRRGDHARLRPPGGQIAIMIAIFSGTAITVPLVIWLTMRSSFDGYGVLDRSIFTQGG